MTDNTFGHQFARPARGRAQPCLQADGDVDSGSLGNGCEFFRFFKIAPQWPFAVNVFAGIKGSKKDLPVLRDLDANRYDVDLVAAHQRQRVAEPMLRAERLGSCPGGFFTTGRNSGQL